jgi:hypothetical protein
MAVIKQPQQIRVPNLPLGKMVDANGSPTATEITFRQSLIRSLQQNFGNEGLVVPSQKNTTAPNNAVEVIQNNTVINPATGLPQYTLVPGTLLYDSTNNNLLVAILVGDTPKFKVVTVT